MHDPKTGRPLAGQDEAVESLTDAELEAELTVTSFDPVRRRLRYDRLVSERLARRRGYRRRTHRPRPA
jgi:hypothetical protein